MPEPLLLPKPETPSQPTYPQTNVVVNPNGVRVSIVFAPGIELSTTLSEETMNQICAVWVKTRKDIADQMRFIEHIHQSKNN